MRIADLGTFSGDILVYGGPYSNLQATEALFDLADARGIPAERRICTGDVVGYCADPVATVAAVRARGGPAVAGNTERQIADGAGDCGCGFGEGTACDLLSRGWYPYALAGAGGDPETRAWLADRPDMAVFTIGEIRAAVIHGGLTDIARFLWPTSPESEFAEEVAAIETEAGPVDTVLAGHSGLAFHRQVAGVHWFNAGAIGLPANNGDPRTRFLVLGEDGARIESLPYDHAGAAAAMTAAGLTQGYHEALVSGWWPSEDVLPPELRRVSPAGDARAPAI